MSKKLNSYNLSRGWFDFCFENPEKISPKHSAIYFFAIEHCNRLGWKQKFGFPSQMTMEALGIKKHQTYIKAFNDLIEWGFLILIQKSTNQYSANIISLPYAMPKNGKALDKAIVKHRAKQGQSTRQSKVHIVKPINQETNKPDNKEKKFTQFKRDDFKKDISEAYKKSDSNFQEYWDIDTTRDFLDYWTEKTANGIMKFQTNKTWETKKRMNTWMRKDYNKKAPSKKHQEQDELIKIVESMPSQFDDDFVENPNQNMPELAI